MKKPDNGKYEQIIDGEWEDWDKWRGHKLRCCDCCLVHGLDFRINPTTGKPQTRFVTDRKATSRIRKREGITIKHGRI